MKRTRTMDSANAQLIYKQKLENDTSAKYVMSALDYKALEEMCNQFARRVPPEQKAVQNP